MPSKSTLEQIIDVSQKAKEVLRSGMELSLTDRKRAILERMFWALGWQMDDPSQVRSDYTERGWPLKVDYAFFLDKKLVMVIKTVPSRPQKVGQDVLDGLLQVAAKSESGWAAVSDCDTIEMFNYYAGTSISGRKVSTVSISQLADLPEDEREAMAKRLMWLSPSRIVEPGTPELLRGRVVELRVFSELQRLLTKPFKEISDLIYKCVREGKPPVRLTRAQIARALRAISHQGVIEIKAPAGLSVEAVLEGQQPRKVQVGRERKLKIEDLAKLGLVSPGDVWVLEFAGQTLTGQIKKNNRLRIEGKYFNDPDKAAAFALGMPFANGWNLFKFTDKDGQQKPVKELRRRAQELRGEKVE